MKTPKEIIINFLNQMGISYASIDEIIDHELDLTIYSLKSDDGKLFYQNNAEALQSLNHVIQAIYEKNHKTDQTQHRNQFVVDINFVNQKHLQELKSKARVIAERVRSFKTPIQMEPMPAYDRLMVHTFLANEADLSTDSEGEGFDRHIVVKMKT